jgi:hypothetical protein
MPNLPRVMLRAPLCVEAWTLLLRVGLAAPDVAPLVGARRRHRAGRTSLDMRAADAPFTVRYLVALRRRGSVTGCKKKPSLPVHAGSRLPTRIE